MLGKSLLADRVETATPRMRFESLDLRETYVFSGKQRFCCGEKLANVRDGRGHLRFAVESCSICARNVAAHEGSRSLFLLCVYAVLLCFARLSVCADCSGMAVLRFLAAAAACV